MESTIAEINLRAVGLVAYFLTCTWNIFDKYDTWIVFARGLRGSFLNNVIGRNRSVLCERVAGPIPYQRAGYKSLRVAHSAYLNPSPGTN